MNKKYKLIISILIVSMFAIPIIINELYKANAGYQTLWEAKDMLSYFGTIIGAVATIIAVLMTIKQNEKQLNEERNYKEKQIRDERKLSIRPYLTLYNRRCTVNEYIQKKEDEIYIEAELESVTAVSYDPPIKAIFLDMELQKMKHTEKAFFIVDMNKKYLFINYYISNVGAGNAIEFAIEHNGNDIISDIAVKVDQTKIIKCFFDLSKLGEKDVYNINIKYKYKDVASFGTYYQKERVNFWRNHLGDLEYFQVGSDLLTKPEET